MGAEGGDPIVINKRKPSVLTFEFFADDEGRLRAQCEEFGRRRSVESAKGKRYQFQKVFGMPGWFESDDLIRLQTAEAGERIQVPVKKAR